MVPFLAFRYLFSTRQRFVPLLAGVAFLGIALSIFFLLVVLGVMGGFQEELSRRWVGLNAHLTVSHLPDSFVKTIQGWPEVKEVERFVLGEVIVEAHQGEERVAVAAKLKGVDFFSEDFLERVRLYPPKPPPFSAALDDPLPPLIGGEELFRTLGIHPDVPERIRIIYPLGEIGPTGDWIPKRKEFVPANVFRTGLYAWDAYTVLVRHTDALRLLGDQAEWGVQIRLKDLSDLAKTEAKLRTTIPPEARVETFAKQNEKLFAALKLERIGMNLLLILFLLVASFSMTGLLLMFLYGKQRDLAVLRAIGLAPEKAREVYLWLGGLLGGCGSLFGGALGVAACYFLKRYPVALPATYYLDYLPVKISPAAVAGVLLLGILLTIFSSWYPARLAGRMQILPMLREE